MGFVCLQNAPSYTFCFTDYPTAHPSKQLSNLTDPSPLNQTSDMPDPIASSPLPKSIDPSSFTDVAVKNASKSIDPGSFTSTSAERYVYGSPPTAADQETRAPSSESRRKTGDKMNVNDVLFGN